MAAWLFSAGISHPNHLPHVPSGCLPSVNSRPCPWVSLQCLCSSSQLMCLVWDLFLSRVCMTVARIVCVILIPFRLPQISCFILSLKCFCCDQNSFPDVGIGPLLQFPNPPRAGLVLLTILFFFLIPSCYPVLKVKVGHLCPTLCNPMDYSPWNSPGHNTGVASLSLL